MQHCMVGKQVPTWVISDTHFHHNKMVEYCGRPKDFTAQLIKNWTKCVGETDLIFHLGDVGFYKKDDCGTLLKELPGNKILIRGNHDRHSIKFYLDHGFMAVMDTAVVHVCYSQGGRHPRNHYYRVILSHSPVAIPEGVDFNLHGHFHNNNSYHWEEELVKTLTPKHRLLSVEELGYKPVPLGWTLHHERFINSYERAKEVRNG